MNEKTTLVVTAVPDPNEMGSVQEYLKGVLPLLMGASGKPVKRLKVNEVIHGKAGGMVLVMDFESAVNGGSGLPVVIQTEFQLNDRF
jgi:hypothetical protein